jgi:hypothetical protein
MSIEDKYYSVSTYHAQFEFFDLQKRAAFYWVCHNNLLKNPDFLIRSFDTSVVLYPQRYFVYKAFAQGWAKFHKSWFFFQNLVIQKKLVQKNLIIIFTDIIYNQFWNNYNQFWNNYNQFWNFKLLLFIVLKNSFFINKAIEYKEFSLYAFFFNLVRNKNLFFKNFNLSKKVKSFIDFKGMEWYKLLKNSNWKYFKLINFVKSNFVLAAIDRLTGPRFKFINRYHI